MAYIATAKIVMAYVVMADIVMAYMVMAYTVVGCDVWTSLGLAVVVVQEAVVAHI